MSERNLIIVFAVFPGMTQLDFTGPHEVFARMPGSEVIVASVAGGNIEGGGLTFAGNLIEAGAHAIELQFAHGLQNLMAFHQAIFLMLS